MENILNTKEDWTYRTERTKTFCLSMKNQQCIYPRGKTLGGSSAINGMIYLRGNQRDYEEWSKDNPGWDYDNILSYFKKIENVQSSCHIETSNYGTEGNLPLNVIPSKHPIREIIINSAKELGINFSRVEVPTGYFDALNNIHDGLRVSSAKAYLSKISRNRMNLFIGTDIQVGSVVISSTNNTKKATGVIVKIGNKTMVLSASKEVILSGGSINSPQMLMNSGIGPKEQLEPLGIKVVQDLKVGENLQDHILYSGHTVALSDNLVYPYDDTEERYKFFKHKRGLYSSMDLFSFVGFVNTLNMSIYPDVQIHHRIDLKGYRRGVNVPILHFMVTLLKPKSRGKILIKSNNPYDRPLIYPNSLSHDDDMATLLRGVQYIEKLMSTKTFKQYNPDIKLVDVESCSGLSGNDFHKCAVRYVGSTIYHIVGTCKMGPKTDKTAVVDSKLRVHGVENLRVIDASIMPTLISVNTNAAAMMIGEKGADFIKETWTV